MLARASVAVVLWGCSGQAAAPPPAPASAPAAVPQASTAEPRHLRGVDPDAEFVEYAPDRRGFLYRPAGVGPFPVVVWNHGSEKLPGWRPELGHFYTANGWAFFVPHRRGHGRSGGDYIGDDPDPARQLALLDEQNADVIAAIAWIKTQPGIDPSRVVVSGCSYGGIETMITAAKSVGIRAAVPFAPGAIMWSRSPEFRSRLIRAAREATVPEFLIQASNDFDLGPSRIAGAELELRDLEHNRVKTYPAYGATAMDGHTFCVAGTEVWGADVLDFLTRATQAPH